MRAIQCTKYGTPELLELMDVAVPHPAANEVRIRTRCASLNYPDGLMVANKYQDTPPLPFTLGQEAAGIIDAVGENISDLKAGDRVAGFGGNGTIADYFTIGRERVVKIGNAVSFDAAAAFTVTYGTTIHALRTRADLKPGETLLVLGAGGGVGTAAVELGKLMGATVIAAASSDEKLAAAKQYGADHLINYKEQDLRASLKEICGKKGVDVVYDPVCGPLAETAFRALAWRGRYLVIGFAAGISALPMNLPLLKGASLIGVFWGASTIYEPDGFKRDLTDIFSWLADGKLAPLIGGCFNMKDTPLALKEMMDGNATGKIVIKISE